MEHYTLGVPGLPNKEFYTITVTPTIVTVTPQDYYPGMFQEFRALGATWNPKSYSFSIPSTKETTVKSILNFYTRASKSPSVKIKKLITTISSVLGHSDMVITHYNGNIVLVDPYALVGTPTEVKDLLSTIPGISYLRTVNSVRTIISIH